MINNRVTSYRISLTFDYKNYSYLIDFHYAFARKSRYSFPNFDLYFIAEIL